MLEVSTSLVADAKVGALAVIPARGGSKRFPRKNLAMLCGKPLVAHAIDIARRSTSISRVIVSTDDPEIAEVSLACGAEVPWLRPSFLADDNSSIIDVLIHLFETLKKEEGALPRFSVLLEPTAPSRTPEHVDTAISMLADSDFDSIVSVSEVPHIFSPEEVTVIEKGVLKPYLSTRTMANRLPRAAQRMVYTQNGIVYAFRPQRVLETKDIYGLAAPLVLGHEYLHDIDTARDLKLFEYTVKMGS